MMQKSSRSFLEEEEKGILIYEYRHAKYNWYWKKQWIISLLPFSSITCNLKNYYIDTFKRRQNNGHEYISKRSKVLR